MKFLGIFGGSSGAAAPGARGPRGGRTGGARGPRGGGARPQFPGGTLAGTMGRVKSVRGAATRGNVAATARRRGLIGPKTAALLGARRGR